MKELVSKEHEFHSSLQVVTSLPQAVKVTAFLSSRNAFDMEISDYGRQAREEGVYDSLGNPQHKFWFVANSSSEVIAAVGINATVRNEGGYELDYFAVHKDFRRHHLGTRLLAQVEQFVRKQQGRFIQIETGDTEVFASARQLYEKMGYEQASHFPNYYGPNDGRIDYYKQLQK